jgi:hypothetical protein
MRVATAGMAGTAFDTHVAEAMILRPDVRDGATGPRVAGTG